MKKYIVIKLILLMLIPMISRAQDELKQYLTLGAENNPGLKVKFNEYMAALERVPQVNTLPDPQLAFSYFIRPVETRVGPQQARISFSQMFPWFGTLQSRENAALEDARARYELFEEEKSLLFRDIRAAYYDLYLNDRSIKIMLENIRILESLREIILVKVEAGTVSLVDEYRIQMEMNDLENQIMLLKDNKISLETEFRNLLNADEAVTIELPRELWSTDFPYTYETAMDSIREGNHRLLNLEIQQSALAYRKEIAQKEGNPDIRVGLDYIFTGKGNNNFSGKDVFIFPSIGLSIPIYRKKYRAMVNEVAYLEVANQQEKEDKLNRIETLFENAWKDYRDSERRIHMNESQMDLADKSLDILEQEYATDYTDFEEILRMERKLLRYSLEYEKALADKQAAIAFMYYLMGK